MIRYRFGESQYSDVIIIRISVEVRVLHHVGDFKTSRIRRVHIVFTDQYRYSGCFDSVYAVSGRDEMVPSYDCGSADHFAVSLEGSEPRELARRHCRPANYPAAARHPASAGLAAACCSDDDEEAEDAKHVWRSHSQLWSQGKTPAPLL